MNVNLVHMPQDEYLQKHLLWQLPSSAGRTLREEKSLVRPLRGCHVSREAAQSSLRSEAGQEFSF